MGGVAGFLGGLLGVGGGAVLSPSLMMIGYKPKEVATTTSVVVPASSLSGLLTYAGMGGFDWSLALWVALPALAGGWLGAHIMHTRLSHGDVRRILGIVVYIMAFKVILSIAHASW